LKFREFTYKNASYRLREEGFGTVSRAIRSLRNELEGYIRRNPPFLSSLVPVPPVEPLPEIARRMHRASELTGLGPMAAVAGTIAQMAVEEGRRQGYAGLMVENGGDVYLDRGESVVLGLYAGEQLFGGKLAFRLRAEDLPLAVCSSSGLMGHSLSLGRCDLATVFARDASLADGAATLAGNLVKGMEDLEPAVNRILGIGGIRAVFLVKDGRVGLGGDIPELISTSDPDMKSKITRDRSERSSFPG